MEVLIRSTQDLNAAFAAPPEHMIAAEQHYLKVAESLRPLAPEGHTYEVKVTPPRRARDGTTYLPPELEFFVDGDRVRVECHYSPDFGKAWRRAGVWTGKGSFRTGVYGSLKAYPTRKDGTFNYHGIAEAMHTAALHHTQYLEDEARKERNEIAVKVLREQFPWAQYKVTACTYYSGGSGRYVPEEGKVILQLGNITCTPQQAERILSIMQEEGVK